MAKSVYSRDYQSVIRRLRRARLEMGLTQEEVAEKFGKPQSFISKIESGERRLDISELKRLIRLYRKDIKTILGE